jgi:hypothetical protein
MKKAICGVFFLAVCVLTLSALDLIVFRDGNTVEAQVVEISPSVIRYKRFDNLNGPVIAIPAARVLSIRYENGTTEIINAGPIAGSKAKTPALEPDKLYVSVSADPSGFLLYGPFVLTEFTKNRFNAQVYVSFPSVGLVVQADGFGIGAGASLNYLWHTRLGAVYFGGLFDYSGYTVRIPGLVQMPSGKYTDGNYDYRSEDIWESSITFALNAGYKFVFSSGLYFNTGANIGAKITDGLPGRKSETGFFIRPNTAVGYNF